MSSIKFSYYLGCRERILKREYGELIRFLKSAEYSAIEPLEFFGTEQMFDSVAEADALASMLRSENITVSCYSVYIDVYEDIPAAEQYLKKQIDIAHALGCPYFHHTLRTPLEATPSGVDINVIMPALLPTLKKLADYASFKGITLLYEPQGLCFNGANLSKLVSTLRGSGVENVGVCLDFGNPTFVDCKAFELIGELLPLIRNVHIKDYKFGDINAPNYISVGGRHFYEVGYGLGDMQCAECVEKLVKSGYNGYFATELMPDGTSPDDAGISAIKIIKDYMK